MSYRLFTDVCSDLPLSYIKKNDITEILMPVSMDQRDFTVYDDPDNPLAIGNNLFYNKMRLGSQVRTSPIAKATFIDAFVPVLKRGMDLMYIALSSGVSETYQHACAAANELETQYPERKIIMVDSLGASLGQGMLVYLCAQKRAQGMPIEQLQHYAEDMRSAIKQWFTVDDLAHLRRSGRMSGPSAMFGTLLGIKPLLTVDPIGRLINTGMVYGRKRSLRYFADLVPALAMPDSPIFISHGDAEKDAQLLVDMIKTKCDSNEMLINTISPIVGAHCGPGTIALFFVGKQPAQ